MAPSVGFSSQQALGSAAIKLESLLDVSFLSRCFPSSLKRPAAPSETAAIRRKGKEAQMAKSRRFSGFLRSLLGQSRSRESRTGENSPLRARSLPSVISKRLRNRVRSFLTRKPSPETAALGIAERQKSEASENSPFMDGGPLQTAKGADVAGQQPPVNPQPEPEPEEQEQQQEQTDDTFDTTLPGGATQTSPGVSPKPSTRTNTGTQEIFDWMNRQFDGDGHRNPVDDTPLPTPSSFNSDSTGPGFDTIEDPGVPLPDHPRTWPIPKPKRRRTSQNPKARGAS